MSAKSTVHLTRAEAERRWIHNMLDRRRSELEILVRDLSSENLEERLENHNDLYGNSLENYLLMDRRPG